MSNIYFDLLIETEKVAKLMNRVIKNYIMDSHIPCNVAQIVILHLLIKMGGPRAPHEIANNMEHLYKNNTYNFQILLKNGYISQRDGKAVGLDKRCVFFDVTDEGNKLYKSVCAYLDSKMKLIKEKFYWSEDNFTDYFDDLEAFKVLWGSIDYVK